MFSGSEQWDDKNHAKNEKKKKKKKINFSTYEKQSKGKGLCMYGIYVFTHSIYTQRHAMCMCMKCMHTNTHIPDNLQRSLPVQITLWYIHTM